VFKNRKDERYDDENGKLEVMELEKEDIFMDLADNNIGNSGNSNIL